MRNIARIVATVSLIAAATGLGAQGAAQQAKPFEPYSGQTGKDVVWVPTPQPLVEKMLDLANLTPKDFLIDLGSGDGRTVITAAKRGSRALGIEYEVPMVELSRKNAEAAGVSKLATFEKADLFETDFSKADVVTMFLLPWINMRLRPIILDMKPGTRVVSNTFTMEDWEADETATADPCEGSWCTALLWIVPAKVDGTWQIGNATLVLGQHFQMLNGDLGGTKLTAGRLRGAEITFTVGNVKYTGRVNDNTMSGTMSGGRTGNWTASRK